MTYLANPRHYAREDFARYIDGLSWSKGWVPQFPTLHNTGVPSLSQWLGYGLTAQERWGANLDRYYQGLGWHSGPHLVCCPDYIWVLCDPEQDGVSVSCWNRITFGIEMVGDYRSGGDDPTTGEGLKVVDNAIFALAVLSRKIGWTVGSLVDGLGRLHFHHECARDGHPCPGDRIDKADIVKRVQAQMAALGSAPQAATAPATPAPAPQPESPPATPAPAASAHPVGSVSWVQDRLNAVLKRPYPLTVDGIDGPATEAAVARYQQLRGLQIDGMAGPETIGALKKEPA